MHLFGSIRSVDIYTNAAVFNIALLPKFRRAHMNLEQSMSDAEELWGKDLHEVLAQ